MALVINGVLTEEQRLSKAVVSIMSEPKYTALAGILMIGDKTIDEDLPTACTNGRDERYGREFINSINDSDIRGVIIHENKHKMYRHLKTWKHLWDIDPQLANMAMDYVIDLEILDENQDGFATLPEGALIDERFRGMDTAQVFNILRKEQESKPTGEGEGSGSGDNESGGDDGQVRSNTTGSQNTAVGEKTGFDEHDWEGAKDMTPDEERDLARDIDEAIRQGAMSAGKMGANSARSLQELLQPQVDWREVLREFINATCSGRDYSTWARPNRRYLSQGVYMPTGISQQVGELVLAIDTSGSVGQLELTVMLTEVKAVCDTVKPDRVRILYWGHEVVGDEVYENNELDKLVQSTKPRGGGGTDVRCITHYMEKKNIKPQATIVLTDGYLGGGWGEWTCPVLWAVLDNKRAVPDTGKTVHIKSGVM